MWTKVIFLVLAGSLLINGFLAYKVSTENYKTQINVQENFPFLSKRIFVENQNDVLINFIPLRANLKEYVEKQNGKVGAYFEYLPSGTSIGVNDKKEVQLASLSKVPITMSIFKKIERKQMALTDRIVIEKKYLDPGFGALWKRGEGASLTLQELIQLSLAESDNTAYNTLLGRLTGPEITEVYRNLDIPITISPKEENQYLHVSPKNYSSIFRSLYLSSFLQEENSNHILNILTQTPFNDKIVAGVPAAIKIAHKIAVFEDVDTSKNVFIDCGIVYIPNRPYVLCAFVLDTNDEAQKHISHISKMIYDYVSHVEGED
ncbi:MAG: serine hydrolase [bacterium]|nr:serine hydrolase [bacterium]